MATDITTPTPEGMRYNPLDPNSTSQIAKRAVKASKKAKAAGGRPPFATIVTYLAALKEIRAAIQKHLFAGTPEEPRVVGPMDYVDLALDILIILDKHGITLGDLAALLPIVKQLVD